MKNILEYLAIIAQCLIIILLLLLIGPIAVICAIIGRIPASLVKGEDILFPKWWQRVGVAVMGMLVWIIVVIIVLTIVRLILFAFRNLPFHQATPTITPPSPYTATPTILVLTSTPTPIPCVCQSATDDETLRCLIHSESEAANNEDLALIQRIFAPDAVIFRGDTGEEWGSPMAYYKQAFAALDFTHARHFDIHPVIITLNFAKYTSGSSGWYSTGKGTPIPYNNPNPSDHWVFVKNELGCWVIQRFEFNASHIPFP